MVQSQAQNQSADQSHLCVPNHPRSPMPALFTCPGCQKVETELCVYIPHLQLSCGPLTGNFIYSKCTSAGLGHTGL